MVCDRGDRRACGRSAGEPRRNTPHDQQSENCEQSQEAMEPAHRRPAESQITVELHISMQKDDSTPARVGCGVNY